MPTSGPKPMRRSKFSKNPELIEIFKQREAVVKRADEIQDLFKPLEDEMKSLSSDMERLKEKTVPIVKELGPELELNEFEIVQNIYLKGDEVELSILDQLEEHKEFLRTNRKEIGVKIDEIAEKAAERLVASAEERK